MYWHRVEADPLEIQQELWRKNRIKAADESPPYDKQPVISYASSAAIVLSHFVLKILTA